MTAASTTAASAATTPHAAAHHEPTASPWPVFWVASVAVFLVSLDSTMLFAAFRAVREGFPGTTAADMSWVLNGYTVVYAAMLIPAGGLSDTHGRKKVFMLGVTLFLAASAACGLAGNVGWLIAARVAQAVGAALLTPASLSIVLAAFPQSKRTIAVSLWGAVGGLAAAVGPSLGSFVVDSVGWPWAFYINLPLGALSLWRGAALLKEAKKPESRRPVEIDAVPIVNEAVPVCASRSSTTLPLIASKRPRDVDVPKCFSSQCTCVFAASMAKFCGADCATPANALIRHATPPTRTGRRAGPPQARPDPPGGSHAVPGRRGANITA